MPRDGDAHNVRDRRDDVDRLRIAVIDPPATLPGVLDEQRYACDVGQVLRGDLTHQAVRLEAHAVICRDDHERSVVQARCLEATEQHAQQPVRVADLKEMPLEGRLDDSRNGCQRFSSPAMPAARSTCG